MVLNNVIVSRKSYGSDDPDDIVNSNIGFLNDLFEEHVRYEEVCTDALKSYYVDYYLAQVNNGGFSQFVYNSAWNQVIVGLVLEGLSDMGAIKNLKLFKRSAGIVSKMSPKNFERYLEGEYFGNFLQINHLNKFNDRFYKLQKSENLININSDWLKSLPNLSVLADQEMKDEFRRLSDSVPDKEKRKQEALAAEPRFTKLIRALCKSVGHELSCITAGDINHDVNGKKVLAWHFIS